MKTSISSQWSSNTLYVTNLKMTSFTREFVESLFLVEHLNRRFRKPKCCELWVFKEFLRTWSPESERIWDAGAKETCMDDMHWSFYCGAFRRISLKLILFSWRKCDETSRKTSGFQWKFWDTAANNPLIPPHGNTGVKPHSNNDRSNLKPRPFIHKRVFV